MQILGVFLDFSGHFLTDEITLCVGSCLYHYPLMFGQCLKLFVNSKILRNAECI